VPAFDKAELLRELPWNPDWVTAVSFLGNTRRLFAGNRLGEILEWELPEKLESEETGPFPIRSYQGHDNAITKLLSTKDGKELYSASFDHALRRWDLETKPDKEEKIVLNAGTIYRQQFSRSGKKGTAKLASGRMGACPRPLAR
jgi:WD40 repeat protein